MAQCWCPAKSKSIFFYPKLIHWNVSLTKNRRCWHNCFQLCCWCVLPGVSFNVRLNCTMCKSSVIYSKHRVLWIVLHILNRRNVMVYSYNICWTVSWVNLIFRLKLLAVNKRSVALFGCLFLTPELQGTRRKRSQPTNRKLCIKTRITMYKCLTLTIL